MATQYRIIQLTLLIPENADGYKTMLNEFMKLKPEQIAGYAPSKPGNTITSSPLVVTKQQAERYFRDHLGVKDFTIEEST